MTPLIGGIGWQEIVLVALVVFLLFGATRLPATFRSLGEGLRSFKEGLSGNEGKAPRSEADEGKSRDRDKEAPGSKSAT